jgi:hypothetical protein
MLLPVLLDAKRLLLGKEGVANAVPDHASPGLPPFARALPDRLSSPEGPKEPAKPPEERQGEKQEEQNATH